MKLLDISSFYSDTGGGVRTYHNWKLAYFREHPVHRYAMVVSSANGRRREASDGGTIYRLPGFPVSKNKSYRQICDLTGLRRVIEREQPDVIEIGSAYLDNWLALAAAAGRRTVMVGFYHADFPDSYLAPAVAGFPRLVARPFMGFWRRYVHFAYGRLDATCVTSRYIEEKLKRTGVGNTIRIPLGVDADLFHPRRRSGRFREALGVGAGETLLLYSGRFGTEKGIETMLAALPVMARRRDRRIVLIGGGPLDAKVRGATRALENVTVLDYVSDQQWLASLYASADIFLSPGPFETFGLSTLEALAAGLPVVAAASGGAYELVRRTDGGEVFAPGDPAAMAAAVDRLAERDARAIGRAARARVEQEFAWDRTFDRMMSVYSRLIAQKRREGARRVMAPMGPRSTSGARRWTALHRSHG